VVKQQVDILCLGFIVIAMGLVGSIAAEIFGAACPGEARLDLVFGLDLHFDREVTTLLAADDHCSEVGDIDAVPDTGKLTEGSDRFGDVVDLLIISSGYPADADEGLDSEIQGGKDVCSPPTS
jgi:hypothetical protein